MLLLTGCIIFGSTAVHAQKFIGINAGLNFATFGGDESSQFQSKLGLQCGLLFDIHLKNKFYLQPGIIYSGKGAGYSGIDFNFRYVEIPLAFKYLSADSSGFILSGGTYISLLAEATVSDASGHEADIAKYFNGFDYGLNAAIGFQFKGGFGMLLKYEYGLRNFLSDATIYANGNSINNNEVISICIFYMQ